MSVRRLHLISVVINEVVGNAISDLLAVELILRHYKWTIEDWDNKLYQDVPNVQIKVPVGRSVIPFYFPSLGQRAQSFQDQLG